MYLENLKRKSRKKPAKRLGRGYGSGVGGHTVGRGQKGQKSRSGHKSLIFFEGGNVPLYRRLPKLRGMDHVQKVEAAVVNLTEIEKNFKDGDVVTIDALKEKKLIRNSSKAVKILGDGALTKKITVNGIPVSESARSKIQAAKGAVK